MTQVLNQHYMKTIGLPTVSTAVVAEVVLTITGSALKLNTADQKVILTLDDAGDVIFTKDSPELTTNNVGSLVLNLSDYDGDTLLSLRLTSAGSYNVAFDVSPDASIG